MIFKKGIDADKAALIAKEFTHKMTGCPTAFLGTFKLILAKKHQKWWIVDYEILSLLDGKPISYRMYIWPDGKVHHIMKRGEKDE